MLDQNHTVSAVEAFVKAEMEWLCWAHDFHHIARVVKLARKIRELEWEGNTLIIVLGALLHESLDDKFFEKSKMAERKNNIINFLKSLEVSDSNIESVMFIVQNVWFWKSLERWPDFVASKEFQIVEDADRLEAIWAIAIARTFTYGGKKWSPMYDPTIKPHENLNRDTYAKSDNTSINHFYEKLLLLKDLMHTKSWSELALKRHEFMQSYITQFHSERDLND